MEKPELVYSSDKEKNDYIKLMKSKATNVTDPELKERILKSLKNKESKITLK